MYISFLIRNTNFNCFDLYFQSQSGSLDFPPLLFHLRYQTLVLDLVVKDWLVFSLLVTFVYVKFIMSIELDIMNKNRKHGDTRIQHIQ